MKYRVQNIVNGEYLDDDIIFLLPNGEVGWFIRDGSYPHYRKFGHQENFRVIDEDCERLQKQLEIAVMALKEIEKDGTNPEIKTITVLCVNNFLRAHKALKEIEELNK